MPNHTSLHTQMRTCDTYLHAHYVKHTCVCVHAQVLSVCLHVDACACVHTVDTGMCVCDYGFPGSSGVKNLPANAEATGYVGSIPGSGRVTGGGNGNPLPYSGLDNSTELLGSHTQTHTHTSMDRGACRATVHEYMCARYTSLNIPSSQMRESQKPLRGRTHVGS